MDDDVAYRVEVASLARRTRNTAVWAVAFFFASVPVALIRGGTEVAAAAGTLLAIVFWLMGLVTSIWAFGLAFRHWEKLPPSTRWLASLPLATVMFLMTAAVVVTTIAGTTD